MKTEIGKLIPGPQNTSAKPEPLDLFHKAINEIILSADDDLPLCMRIKDLEYKYRASTQLNPTAVIVGLNDYEQLISEILLVRYGHGGSLRRIQERTIPNTMYPLTYLNIILYPDKIEPRVVSNAVQEYMISRFKEGRIA